MFCPTCGCWNPDDSINCSTCATSLQTAVSEPVKTVSPVSFADRWRKVAASPVLLVLAAVLTVTAILNIENIVLIFRESKLFMEYDPLLGVLMLLYGVSTFSVCFSAAGLWLTCWDSRKKASEKVSTLGVKLTFCALFMKLAGIILDGTILVVVSNMEGMDGLIAPLEMVLAYGVQLLYWGLLFAALVSAYRSAKKRIVSAKWISGAAVVSYVFAALLLIMAVFPEFAEIMAAPATAVLYIANMVTFVLQGAALSVYKAQMTK